MIAIKNTIDVTSRDKIKIALSAYLSESDFERYSEYELGRLFFGFEMGFMMAENELHKSGYYFKTEKQ